MLYLHLAAHTIYYHERNLTPFLIPQDHACQVVLSATFLIKEYHKEKDNIDVLVENNPFVRFITVFAALIHDVKHVGMPNAQLVKDNHCLCSVYEGSYLERQSIQIGLGIFIEDFPDLSTFVLQK